MMLIFVLKCSKFNLDSKNAMKLLQNLGNCIWTGSGKFFLLLPEYSLSAVNVLKGYFDRYKKVLCMFFLK